MYIPALEHKVTAKINVDAGEAKGDRLQQDIAFSNKGDGWMYTQLFDQGPSLFDTTEG